MNNFMTMHLPIIELFFCFPAGLSSIALIICTCKSTIIFSLKYFLMSDALSMLSTSISHGMLVREILLSGKQREIQDLSFSFWQTIQEIAHFFSTSLVFLLACERAYQANYFSSRVSPHIVKFSIFILTLIQCLYIMSIAYCMQIEQYRIPGVLINVAVEIFSLIILAIASKKSKSVYSTVLSKAPLDVRYRMREVFDTSRSLLPIQMLNLLFRLVTIAVVLLVFGNVLPFAETLTAVRMSASLNALTISSLFILRIRSLRHQVRRFLNIKSVNVVPECHRGQDMGDIYMEQLKSQWK